jgi:hypothetical protein
MDKFWNLSQQKNYAMEAKKLLAKMLIMVHDHLPWQTGN